MERRARCGSAGEPPRLAAITYAAGALLCHQLPERSFHLHGAQMPVCARCAGLYLGACVGVLAWAVASGLGSSASARTQRLLASGTVRRALIGAALPTGVTVAAAWLGLWDPGNIVRAALALPLGAVTGALVAATVARDLR